MQRSCAQISADRAVDRALSEHSRADIQNGRLPWGHAEQRLAHVDDELARRDSRRRGHGVGVSPHLHVAVKREKCIRRIGLCTADATRDRIEPRPREAAAGELGNRERLARPDHDLVRTRAHLKHEARATVGSGNAEVESAALADREARGAVMRTDGGAVAVDDRAHRWLDAVGKPAARVAVGDEADVVTVGLECDRQTPRCRFGAHNRLRRRRAEREHRVRELLGRQHAEHV